MKKYKHLEEKDLFIGQIIYYENKQAPVLNNIGLITEENYLKDSIRYFKIEWVKFNWSQYKYVWDTNHNSKLGLCILLEGVGKNHTISNKLFVAGGASLEVEEY